MKNLLVAIVYLFFFALLSNSCSSSQGAVANNGSSKSTKLVGEGQSNTNLAEFLRKNTSLNIKGSHPNVAIDIRGLTSIEGDTRPFFVIDGIRMGRSYVQANNAVNLTNIKSVRILKSLSQLAVYGNDGVNGVIIIDHAN